MAERTIFRDDLVVAKSEKGHLRLGTVQQVGGVEDSDESSDSESEDLSFSKPEKGFVRVAWYRHPNRSDEVVSECQLTVVDRSCLPRDVVRTKDGNQLGTVLGTDVHCDLMVIGTSKFLKDICVSKLVSTGALEEGDLVSYGPWVGRIQQTFENLVLKFSNGSRAKLDHDTAEEQDLLLDVYPDDTHESDMISQLYYPSQFLRGPAKAFKDIKWVSGDKIEFRPKIRYKVLIEQIELHGVKVKWGTRAFPEDDANEVCSCTHKTSSEQIVAEEDDVKVPSQVESEYGSSVDPQPDKKEEKNPAEPPPAIINDEKLKSLHRLDHFWHGHVWVGERFRLHIQDEQAKDLNNQVSRNSKKTKKARAAKRMERKLHQSTSQGALDAAKSRKRKNKKSNSASSAQHESANDVARSDDESACDDDDSWSEDGEESDSELLPSAGSCASIPKEEESEVDILVNNESDLNITSPIGQIPTILGMMSCRVGSFELDFTLVQENGPHPKKRFQCNIQNPECSKDAIEKISKLFQEFMKTILKKNKHLLSSTSCAAMMAQCPQAVRTFISQQPSVKLQEIFFEYTADGKHTSGIIDKDGQKSEVEYEDNETNLTSLPQAVEMITEVFNSVLDGGGDVILTTAPPGKKQAGPNVKFEAGQWISVEVAKTNSTVDVQWQDGSIQKDIRTPNLLPAHHVDDNDFCPGDFVIDKRVSEQVDSNYGVVLKVDSQNRMTKIQWIRNKNPAEIEEVSSYEIADHEELQFRISDIVLRVGNKQNAENQMKLEEDDQGVGELLRITEQGMLKVLWSNGTVGLVHPQDVINVPNDDDDNTIFESSDDEDQDDASWTTASSDEDASLNDSDSQSEIIGDQPGPIENGIDSFEINHGMGEGSHEASHDATHENGTCEMDKIIHKDVVEFIDEITEVAFDRVESKSADAHQRDQAEPRNHKNNSQNHGEADKLLDVTNGTELDMNDNTAKPSTVSHEEPNVENVQSDDRSSNDQDDVTATISSESLSSNEDAISNSTDNISFFIEPSAPSSHHFVNRYFDQSSSKTFIKTVQRDLKLLRTSLPPGIIVKAFEDRMDLLSVLIEGPVRTPYEDGIFCFDVCLSSNYPESPPSVHYISFSPRLNPNLYETGRVCVSLLGTWIGKGSERWTKESTVLQVLLSIQGLILNSEPYYNEAGYEGHRGTAEGMKNSRCYNEMVILRLVQHMASLLQNPPEAFVQDVKKFCTNHIPSLLERVKKLVSQIDLAETDASNESSSVDQPQSNDLGFPLLPLSKGVILSLKTRLQDLESAVKATEHLYTQKSA